MPFTVLCIDDNEMLIDALERRLSLEPGFQRLIRVENFQDAVLVAERTRPSLVLLDVDLPGGVDAMSMLVSLTQQVPDSPVVLFTGYPSGELLARSMSLGAWGFVSKGVGSDRLIGAIRRVLGGEAVIELEE